MQTSMVCSVYFTFFVVFFCSLIMFSLLFIIFHFLVQRLLFSFNQMYSIGPLANISLYSYIQMRMCVMIHAIRIQGRLRFCGTICKRITILHPPDYTGQLQGMPGFISNGLLNIKHYLCCFEFCFHKTSTIHQPPLDY